MIEFVEVSRDRRKFLALTGLTLKEFKILLPAFTDAYAQTTATTAGPKRLRHFGGGRRGQLPTVEQKLLFILVYQKTYPLQVVMGELFGMGQSAANQWIHRLLPILRDALAALGVKPERAGQQFASTARAQDESPDYIIDGTERRRQRPKTLKNRHFITVGRRRPIATRTSLSSRHAPSE